MIILSIFRKIPFHELKGLVELFQVLNLIIIIKFMQSPYHDINYIPQTNSFFHMYKINLTLCNLVKSDKINIFIYQSVSYNNQMIWLVNIYWTDNVTDNNRTMK